MTFDRFSVVRVPFPFTDRNATKNRPALVVVRCGNFQYTCGALGHGHDHLAQLTGGGMSFIKTEKDAKNASVAALQMAVSLYPQEAI